MEGRSPGGATALPPSATTILPGGAFTAAQPSAVPTGCEVRRRWGPQVTVGTALAALGGGSKLAVPQAEQLLQLGIQLAEPLQVAGGEGRVGSSREPLGLPPPRGERRVGGRRRVASRGEQAAERGGHAPPLPAVLSPREKYRVDAGRRTTGGRLAEQRLLEEEGTSHIPESGHAGRRRVGGPDE